VSAEAIKENVKVCMFDQYGTVVDMQGGLTAIATPFLRDKDGRAIRTPTRLCNRTTLVSRTAWTPDQQRTTPQVRRVAQHPGERNQPVCGAP